MLWRKLTPPQVEQLKSRKSGKSETVKGKDICDEEKDV